MSDDRQEPTEGQPDDRTRPISPAGGDPDETAPLGPTPDETAPLGRAPDETAPLDRAAGSAARADEDASLPPAQRSGPAAWSGRAEVPSVRPGADPESAGGEWYPDEQGGRPWWLPILWGIVLLILLSLLGVGIWLARQAMDGGGSSPESPQPTTQAPPTSASPSPTRPSPSPPPTSAAPVEVPVPPLVGLPEAAARALLDGLDLDHQVEYRPSDQPAGTVISTDPEAGELVEAGDQVTLVVATTSPSPSLTTGEPTTEPTTEPTATASPTG
ncbi:PASTA domain-containing protein [Micromonospora sp. Llam7]|uniref:PASTA domain-containing protein n=1 Tax=Micromonospora tarapacensis TaxID=2835305 RepID=UPI001C83E43D|nr:PASTA domain-containing protein [Micromonospora tarapacensis]MBX7269812.1 PASTA domain-containing protein [Micromonospora tarapacensis]